MWETLSSKWTVRSCEQSVQVDLLKARIMGMRKDVSNFLWLDDWVRAPPKQQVLCGMFLLCSG